MKTKLCLIGLIAGWFLRTGAALPEPDNVVYGLLTFGGVPVTAANTNVTVAAAFQPNGVPIATYQMGAQTSLGNFYSLRLSLEALAPVMNAASTLVGQTVYLTVSDSSGVRAQAAYTVGQRGQITRLDLAGANAGQTSHPADLNPSDSTISIGEVVAYSLAWRNGTAWTVAPTNIPVSYAVRAGALWRGGEGYRLDSTAGSPPAWWINTNGTVAVVNPALDSAVSALPSNYTAGVSFTVTNVIMPAATVGVYAVEDQVPAGWLVSSVGQGGTFDALNRKVKWGLYFDAAPRALTYLVTPPTNAAGAVSFVGAASFDGLVNLDLVGQRTTVSRVGPMSLQVQGGRGGFHLQVSGNPGQHALIETSTDLKTWQPLATVTVDASGSTSFTDVSATNRAQFYRSRPAP